MAKLIGYIVMLIGVAVIAARLLLKSLVEKVPLLNDIKMTAMIGLALIIIGFVITSPSSSSKTPKHLPVYDKSGKKVVGYRESK